jgi:hypothetical protein
MSLNFIDLNDTPNRLLPNHLLTSDGKELFFTEELSILKLVNNGQSHLKGNLYVNGTTTLTNDVICNQGLSSKSLSVHGDINCIGKMNVSGEIVSKSLQTEGLKTTINQLKIVDSLECSNVKTSKVNCENMDTDNLVIHKSVRFPDEISIHNLKLETLDLTNTAYISKIKAKELETETLNSKSAVITDLTSISTTSISLKSSDAEIDTLKVKSIYQPFADQDGTFEEPQIKELDFDYFQRIVYSNKYVWFGKLKSPNNQMRIKINTETENVLGKMIPTATFHCYDLGIVSLQPNFKRDIQILPVINDSKSFIVVINFSANLPTTAKFCFGLVLEKI